MDSLVYSLNAVLPVFLTIIIGYILRRIHIINDAFTETANKFNFKVTLPSLLFLDMATADIRNTFNGGYAALCAAITTVIFILIWVISRILIKDKSIIGEFVQASYRSSVAIFAIAFMHNIYGNSGPAPTMIIGCVPLYNIYAVTVLTIEGNREQSGKDAIKKTVINVIKNPIIIAIAAGAAVSLTVPDMPQIIDKTVNNLAVMATPLALIAIGAGFEGRSAIKKIKPTLVAALIKTVILPCIFVPVAIHMGFRDMELVVILVMLGSPTTPSCYVMAKNMYSDGVLTSSVVVMTTILSAFTLTLWIFLVRFCGYIA